MEQNVQIFIGRMEEQDPKLANTLRKIVAKLEAYYPEHQVFALGAIDEQLRDGLSKIHKDCGCATIEELLQKCGFTMISGDAVKALRNSVLYRPGEEPDVIKGKVESICRRLQEYYPERHIPTGVETAHKSLSSDITGIYQWLGYPERSSFLNAYGYTMELNRGGRPAEDPMIVINELKRRYANGPTCKKIDELKAENPDLAPKFKNLTNNANKFFGMTLARYFVQEGILLATGRNSKTRTGSAGAGQEEYEKLRLRYAGKPFCGAVSEIWDANSDLDWTAIRKYAQSQGVHLKELLPRDGILISPKDQIIAIVQDLAGRYPDPAKRPVSLEELQQDNPELDLRQLGAEIWREFRRKPEEFLILRGVLRSIENLPPVERLKALAAGLRRRYAGKPLPTSAAALQRDNPDFSVAALDRLSKNTLGKSSIEFLLEQGLLDLTPRWLYEYENFRYWTQVAGDAFDALEEIPLDGKHFFVTGQYAAAEELEQTAARLRALGGTVVNGPLRELDYIVGVHPSPCAWARRLNLNGHSLWVMSSGMVDRLLTAGR